MTLSKNYEDILSKSPFLDSRKRQHLNYCIELPFIPDLQPLFKICGWLDELTLNQTYKHYTYYITDINLTILTYYFFFSHKEDALLFKLIFG